MTSSAIPGSRSFNPWLVAIAVIVPTFMEVLDTTIANVALRYIAGGLSAAQIDSEWVITSYLAANALVLTISGWLSARLGRRNYFLLSIAVFTIASGLCGMATSLPQIIVFRVLQGLAGGGLQPSSQGVLMDTFPPEKQGTAMSLFGIAALIGPIVGPTLGGWLVDNYNWRWIFFVNVPVGAIAFGASYIFVRDPDYLVKQRAELRKQPLNFDTIGFGLLALTVSSWEILLSKGQEWDWFGDPFGRIQTLTVIFTVGLAVFVLRSLKKSNALINLNVFRERNLAVGGLILFCAFAALYSASIALPAMLQTLFGYNALNAGLILSPGGISSITVLVIVSFLLGKGVDARWLIATGLVVLAISNFWTANLNLEVGPYELILPRMVLTGGLGFIFAPITMAALLYTPRELRGSAIAIVSLLRNEGGSFGTSMSQTIEERREQFHLSRLNDAIDLLNPDVNAYLEQLRQFYFTQSGDWPGSQELALQSLADLRQQQAASLAYFDVFWLAGVLAALLVPVVFVMKRSVAEKGARVGAE